MDFDDILEDLGEFGTYQKIIVYVVLLPAVVPCGFHAYNQIFMSAKPDHWCRVPELEDRGLSPGVIKNLSVPVKSAGGGTAAQRHEECLYYDRNYSGVWSSGDAEKVPCREGWSYDASKYESTIVTEWNLVCERDLYPTLALVLFGLGGALGNWVFGRVQDSLGRKIAFFLCLLVESVFGVASAFVPDFSTWTLLRVGVGFTVPAILESPYVLAVELVGPEKRAYCTMLINVAYTLGLVGLSGVFYLVRDWRQLSLVTSLPFFLLFAYWWVMPESPRWLFAKGEFAECARILKKMAAVNRVPVVPDYTEEFEKNHSGSPRATEGDHGVVDLFKHPNLRRTTIIITLVWFTNTAVYVGLSYYAPALGTDEFLNFFLAAVVELPAYVFLWPALEKFGRRWTLCLSMVAGGLACLATILTDSWESVTLALYCLGKMGISCSFVVLPLMASELYPTVVRGIGISFSSAVGQVGPVFVPLINYLGEDRTVLPLLIMGALLVIGGVLGSSLPETQHRRLPETLHDAETFGENPCKCWRSRLDPASGEIVDLRPPGENPSPNFQALETDCPAQRGTET